MSNLKLDRRRLLFGSAAAALSIGALPALQAAETDGGSKLPDKWDETFDVVIVGSGFAGRAAAAAAAQAGAKTVIFEKMPVAGGNSAINGGGYACWTDNRHMREKLGLGEDSAQLHKADCLKGGNFFNMPELVDVLVNNAPEAMNWMLDEGGLELQNNIGRVGGHSAYRDHMAASNSGQSYLDALERIGRKYGAGKVRTRQEVVRLYKDGTGRIVGVAVKSRRVEKNVRALRGVVLAAGGFARDVEYRLKLVPTLSAAYNSTNQPGATADTLMMALESGADALHLAFIQLYPTANPDGGIIDKPALYPTRGPGFGAIFVTKAGKRFVSELATRDVVSQAEIATGDDRTWCVFSQAMVEKMTTQAEIDEYAGRGRVKRSETIEALAKAMDVPPAVLSETIAEHNKALAAGEDKAFGKPMTKAMLPIEAGPFYAVAQWPSVHHCQGGVRINSKAEVLDVRGKPIRGLYAAGEFVGGVHGNNRLGGNATSEAIVFGRIAGRNAAASRA